MKRRAILGIEKLQLFTKRFYPAGNYTWTVPPGCTEVDVFLVGAGGSGASSGAGGGGGYTKTYKKDQTGWRDGGAISVTPGQSIPIIVGAGALLYKKDGGYSQFLNSNYRANGGRGAGNGQTDVWSDYKGGNGGSGGAPDGPYANGSAGSDGNSGVDNTEAPEKMKAGLGQGHTTRDFGEPTGKRNAGGGDAGRCIYGQGVSDYDEGSGASYSRSKGGGGYGGGGAHKSKGGDGTVLIRYWAYEE